VTPPTFRVGDLVSPDNPWGHEENPDAIGIIVEMRSMLHRQPEARILWNDMLDVGPKWTLIGDISPIEREDGV
jgi:hypothetical protein